MANQSALDPLLQAKNNLSRRLLQRERAGLMLRTRSVDSAVAAAAEGLNVHAIGIGRRIVEGTPSDDLAVKVYVSQKLPASLIGEHSIPAEVDGVPTDVVESPPAFLLPNITAAEAAAAAKSPGLAVLASPPCSSGRRSLLRPVPAGVSTGHYAITAGTIACFCHSQRSGDDPAEVYVLSNNHVFADVNNGNPGDALLQPGRADGGELTDEVARLERFIHMHLGGTTPNRVDAAIGKLLTGVHFDPAICSIGAITGHSSAAEGMRVRKHGRTTGLTEGAVADVSYDALVGMDHMNPSIVAFFEDQIRIERVDPYPWFGLGGDSGSLVVADEGTAVGLYFAGPETGSYGVANPIEEVLSELEIALI